MGSGGFRVGAGRPRKNPDDKKWQGKPAPVAALKRAAEPPKPAAIAETSNDLMGDYFAAALKECGSEIPSAEALRKELVDFIAAQGCLDVVPPQTITDYVLARQGYLATEMMNRKLGRLVSGGKLSPYVQASAQYNKAMRDDFNLILQIINKHNSQVKPEDEKPNEFLKMLTQRGF